jgi:cysteine desulfurase
MAQLKQKLKHGLLKKIPDISFNGDQENCLPNTLNVTFDYVEGESILLYADFEGIEVSTGSACSTGSLEPSHVIMAMGKNPENAHGSVRFSLGRENTETEIDYVIEKMPKVIERLRKMSPLYKDASY